MASKKRQKVQRTKKTTARLRASDERRIELCEIPHRPRSEVVAPNHVLLQNDVVKRDLFDGDEAKQAADFLKKATRALGALEGEGGYGKGPAGHGADRRGVVEGVRYKPEVPHQNTVEAFFVFTQK